MNWQNISQLDQDLQKKISRCRQILSDLGCVVVAFSGGVDSTFLLALAVHTLGRDKVIAVVGRSPIQPRREQQQATDVAAALDAELVEVFTDELENPAFIANPPDRCYHCKLDIFGRFTALADQRGFAGVLSGTNADDLNDYRPGMKAQDELGIRNPLLEAGVTKAEIRAASRAIGLPTWDKPSLACLASRIPYGHDITPAKLVRIDVGENALRDLGFAQCRVRDHETVARVEVPPQELSRVLENRKQVLEAIKAAGYAYVCLDLEGYRTGAMNEVL